MLGEASGAGLAAGGWGVDVGDGEALLLGCASAAALEAASKASQDADRRSLRRRRKDDRRYITGFLIKVKLGRKTNLTHELSERSSTPLKTACSNALCWSGIAGARSGNRWPARLEGRSS